MMNNNKIYEAYKPLKNHLGKVDLAESLRVIWCYIQDLQFKGKFHPDIEVSPEYLNRDKIQKSRMISEWNLAILATEVIINSPQSSLCPETLRKSSYFARAVNKLKDIENAISKEYIDKGNVLFELHRISHQQFPWQTESPDIISLTRHYKLYNTELVNKLLKKAIGLNAKELFALGGALFGFFLNHVALDYPPRIEIETLNQEMLDKFIKHFSRSIEDLKTRLKNEQQFDDTFLYHRISHKVYPIVRMEYQKRYSLVCPCPTLLFWRLTNGLYYEIVNEGGFDNSFGKSFQSYVGEVLEITNSNKKIHFYPEETYKTGDGLKHSVDWIIDEGDSALFVECKSKRMKALSKAVLDRKILEEDLEKIADAVVQVYKTIRDYKNNL